MAVKWYVLQPTYLGRRLLPASVSSVAFVLLPIVVGLPVGLGATGTESIIVRIANGGISMVVVVPVHPS